MAELETEPVFAQSTVVFSHVLHMLKKQDGEKHKMEVMQYLCFPANEKDPAKHIHEFTPIYKDSVKQMHRIKPHADPECYPGHLFRNLSPHRKDDEAEWIKNNYECVTLPVWIDFQNTIKRGINQNNWKIAYPDKWPDEYTDSNPKVYLEDGLKLFGSISTWFSNQLFDVKLKDANGVIAVQPYRMNFEHDESGAVYVAGDMVEPVPVYYSSDKVLAFEEDEYYLLLSDEKSPVEYSGKIQKVGYVFYWFDKQNIIRIFQTGKKTDWTFTQAVYIEHGWDAVPVWKLKGQPEMRKQYLYFQSPFDFAVGSLNLVLKNQINKQMAQANCAWPHRIMIGDECDFEDDNWRCVEGKLMDGSGNTGGWCSACHGSGVKDKPSPGSTMVVDETKIQPNGIGIERIRFVSPETDVLDHLQKTMDQDEIKARNILHIYSTNSEATGNDPTATGKWIDLKAMYAFIRPIIDEGFDILEGVTNAIVYMRYGNSIEPVKIIRPVDLDYKTSADYLAEYTNLLEKGAPPIVLYKVLEKYIQTMFYSSSQDRQVWKLVLAADSVAAKKDEEIRNMVGVGTLAKWQAVLHTSIFMFINELIQENPKFLELEFEEQKRLLFEKAQKATTEIQSSSPSALNTQALIDGLATRRPNPGQAAAA